MYKVSDARNQLLADVSRSYPDVNLDSLFKRSGVYDLIIPNLLFDRTMTELSHAESAAYVSPTSGYVSAEQRIVSKGEIVTPEIAQILDSYKAEYNKTFGYEGPRILLVLGDILIALALVVILYFCIYFTYREIFAKPNRYYYLLTVFSIAAFVSFLMERIAPSLVYVVPFAITVLYLQAFFPKRVVLPVYMVSLLPLLIFSGNGVELFFMFLCAGIVAMNTFKQFNRGWKQFLNALIIFGVELIVFAGFRLIDAGRSLVWLNVLQLFGGAMLTVAFYPLIYVFEKVFNLVSTNRLEELADTNNNLLRDLAAKAPGTFQHSLQVENMVTEAGRAVHANVPLLRAAALYHDLGKMKNPLCFQKLSRRPEPARKRPGDHRARLRRPGDRQGWQTPGRSLRLHPDAPRYVQYAILLQPVLERGRRSGRRGRLLLQGPQAAHQGGGHPDDLRLRGGRFPHPQGIHAGVPGQVRRVHGCRQGKGRSVRDGRNHDPRDERGQVHREEISPGPVPRKDRVHPA